MFDALQMAVLLRLRLSLGFVLSLLKNDFYRNLTGKSTLCLRPESTPPYNRQGRVFATFIYLNVIITLGSTYL